MYFLDSDHDLTSYKDPIISSRQVFVPHDSLLPVIKILELDSFNDIEVSEYRIFVEYCNRLFGTEYVSYTLPSDIRVVYTDSSKHLVTFEPNLSSIQDCQNDDSDTLFIPLHKRPDGQKALDQIITESDFLSTYVNDFLDLVKSYWKDTGNILDLEGGNNVYFFYDYACSPESARIVVTNSATKHYFHHKTQQNKKAKQNSMDYANHLCDLIGKNHIFD
jgi:hypothetical protein